MNIKHLQNKLFLITLFIMSFTASSQEKTKPNIVLIMADDLGYGDLGSYGHPLNNTKNLDRLASEGMRFTSFYSSASTCTPARASLLTGRYPLRSGMPRVIYPESENGLPASEITIAEILKDAGYQTKCVGKWHLGQNNKEHLPTSQGFDEYYGLITSNDMIAPWVETEVPLKLYENDQPLDKDWEQSELTSLYTEKATDFIKNSDSISPFFLYLPHNMPHVPIAASEKFRGSSKSGKYGDVLSEMDWSTGKILQALKDKGVEDNTIVLFLSDNGPWNNMSDRMFQEDIVKPWDAGTTGLLRGGKINSYEGGFRVPLIVKWPGTVKPGTVSSEVTTIMDLLPTLSKAAGEEAPKDRKIDGQDLTGLLTGEGDFSRNEDFFYFEKEQLEAVRSGPWKLRIAPYQGRYKDENTNLEPELYNLRQDPSELFNQAEKHPEIVAKLKEKMKEFDIEGAELHFE